MLDLHPGSKYPSWSSSSSGGASTRQKDIPVHLNLFFSAEFQMNLTCKFLNRKSFKCHSVLFIDTTSYLPMNTTSQITFCKQFFSFSAIIWMISKHDECILYEELFTVLNLCVMEKCFSNLSFLTFNNVKNNSLQFSTILTILLKYPIVLCYSTIKMSSNFLFCLVNQQWTLNFRVRLVFHNISVLT